ncbi:MAG: hypothetical protein ACKVPX_18145 [Myxococcaceae bacterium]
MSTKCQVKTSMVQPPGRQRVPGHPSKAAPFLSRIERFFEETPQRQTLEISRRLREDGYGGSEHGIVLIAVSKVKAAAEAGRLLKNVASRPRCQAREALSPQRALCT